MTTVAEWLESPEGEFWARTQFAPVSYGEIAAVIAAPETAISAFPGSCPRSGYVDPAYDPCGPASPSPQLREELRTGGAAS